MRITIPSELKLKERTSHQSPSTSWIDVPLKNKYLITKRMDLEIARGFVQLFNTIVHFPAKIVIQAGVLETWAIVTVNMKSLTPFALVWHNAHTPAGPVFALRSPRGFLTQPLEQCVSEDCCSHRLERCALQASRFTRNRLPFTQVTFVEESMMDTFHFEQRQCAVSLPLSLIAHSHVTKISMALTVSSTLAFHP